jgi:hypothetical protein
LKSKRSSNGAIAFRDPFDPALKIMNDFGADVFFDPDRPRLRLAGFLVFYEELEGLSLP